MLSELMGSKNLERILFFMLINEKCYGTQLHRVLQVPLTPIQKGLSKLEKTGLIQGFAEGKTRYYRFNPVYPLKKEFECLLRKAYEILPTQEKKKYYLLESAFSSPSMGFREYQETLLDFWNRLKSVHALQTHAKLQSDEDPKQGKAEVRIVEESSSVLYFYETGSWEWENGHEMQFSNTLRWSLDLSSGMIGLEHLRHGASKPVFLFYLKPKSKTLLLSVDSHLCGSDAYFGKVQLSQHYFQLSWKIVGPKKNDRIESLYW